ncbi:MULTISPECIES: BON domain-containing protein [Acidobacterium]|uniref:Osmotically inducible protein Y domain protein n=1 Tax=Acidobacterium capsulatum (strain ATCC 51196 / DSM 11244 / BCRC 80197 / JCM 7670 / NBRC 15755 / NCIMB 13165 / 161) TaxID=240015 RepID=C1F1Z2_ACIC5|nr:MULTISPECIES: BON domain-containing protein [Acidobacterium]ACO32882.1 osmotically inducible protein Y domain protein [Acidobacterium capsulatum ATCC 51196]HCT61271.1 BON domain-containing protein [Acidobacterium sp.]
MTEYLGEQRSDERVRNDVMREIEWDPAILSQDIGITVHQGVVTLTGFVHSFPEKFAAERAAKSVYGVRSLANDIQVKPKLLRTDPEIARDILHALEVHPLVPHEKLTATTREGFVTLEGELEWDYQRRNAESAAAGVSGVRGVTNSIRIKPALSSSQVKEKIEAALKRSAEVDARRIHVTLQGSTVELHGSVRSWLEREEAERAAWAAPGVAHVIDHISVTP